MLTLLMTPMLAYFLMLLTVVILASIGVDVRDLDTANLFVIYIQILTILIVLRWLKRKVYTEPIALRMGYTYRHTRRHQLRVAVV